MCFRPIQIGLVWALMGVSQAVLAGPITFNTALPIHEGETILRGQGKLLRSTDDPSPRDRELTVWAAPSIVAYGITEDLTLFGAVPYLDKELELDTPRGRVTRGDNGLGDSTLLARYTVKQWDRPGETLRLAPFVGLKTPTGEDDETDALGRLPQPLQLGSGSWDPIVGTIFTWQTLDWELDTALSYREKTEANDFEFGDETELDLSYQYRLLPRALKGGKEVPGFLYGVLESNLIWQERHDGPMGTVSDSGGTTWFLAPGIQYVRKRWVLEAAVQIPVAQDLNGRALENDFIATAGFRVNF